MEWGRQGPWGGKKGEFMFNGDRVSVEKVLEMDGDDGCTTV